MVYKWKTGCRHLVSAETAAAEFNRLAAEDRLTAKDVVDAAREESAPLHREFEWDDSIAGERWREEQARMLIRHIVIVPEEAQTVEPVRAFHHITVETSNYTPMEIILKHSDMTEQLLSQAKNELKAFKRKYAGLEALTKVFAAIDETLGDDE